MRKFLSASALISSLALIGCARESTPGGPGARETSPIKTGRNYRAADEDRTFTLKVPTGTTNIERGDSEEATISIDRGDEFTQAVTLQFKAPAGIKVDPSQVQLSGTQEEAKVLIDVSTDAALGKTTIEVTATPATGKAVNMPMHLEVDEK